MKIAFATHRGAVRPVNQDALQLGAWTYTGDRTAPETLEVECLPLLVSVVDGLGGHNGGERAAGILADALALGSSGFGSALDPEADRQLLRSLLASARNRMNADVRQAPALSGMGAAVAGLLIRERSALAFNCGDCRAYRLSGGEAERLTRDHSVVQQLFEGGEISEDEMRFHPRKNVVTSAVIAGDPEFELFAKPLSRAQSDVFFLCSDGVWEALSHADLTRLLNAPDAPEKLFDTLLASGCRDNISFMRIAQ